MSTPNQFAFKITPHWDAANEVLTFETNVSGQLHREAVCFKDRVVRQKLIELGWTPPPTQEFPRDTREDHLPWTEPDRSGGGGHTPDEIARAAGDVW